MYTDAYDDPRKRREPFVRPISGPQPPTPAPLGRPPSMASFESQGRALAMGNPGRPPQAVPGPDGGPDFSPPPQPEGGPDGRPLLGVGTRPASQTMPLGRPMQAPGPDGGPTIDPAKFGPEAAAVLMSRLRPGRPPQPEGGPQAAPGPDFLGRLAAATKPVLGAPPAYRGRRRRRRPMGPGGPAGPPAATY